MSQPDPTDRADPPEPSEDPVTEAVFSAALELLASGLTTKQACKKLHINRSTLWRYATASEARRDSYAHARDQQARALADETLEISDQATNEGERVARLRVDTRKWLASKLLPKEFGDRLEVSGTFANLDVRQLTDDQIRRLSDGEAPASVLTAVIPRALPAPEPLPNVVAADDDTGA
jgi:hypothetical protein